MENKTNIEWRLLDKLTGALHLDNRGEFIYELCFLRYVSIKAFKELANQESVNIDDIIRKYNNLLNSTDKYSYFENCIENIDLITDTVKEIEKFVYSINEVKEIVSVLTSYSDVIIKNIMNYDLLCNEGIRGGYEGTPEQICRIVNLFLDINKNDDVLDICSSYGNFLVNVGNCCSYKSLTGIEINTKASLISKIRLATLGFKSNIINMDLFSLEYNKKYDKILCDYPWGMRFDRMTQDYLSYSKDR